VAANQNEPQLRQSILRFLISDLRCRICPISKFSIALPKEGNVLTVYFANGSGLTWNFTSLLVVPLPVSVWNGARVANVV